MSKGKRTYRTLSEKEIRDYLQGKVTGKDAHEMERHLLNDAFDREAVDGLESFESGNISADIHSLRQKINQRGKKRFLWLRVAAVVALLLASTVVVWFTVDYAKETPPISINEPIGESASQGPDPASKAAPPQVAVEADKKQPEQKEPQNEVVKPQEQPTNEAPQYLAFEQLEPNTEVQLESDIEVELASPSELEAREVFPDRVAGLAASDMEGGALSDDSRKKMSTTGAVSRSMSGDASIFAVRGQVTDDTGDPLPGVSVVIKGTTKGAMTDLEGYYHFEKVPEGAVLVFSFVGFGSVEAAVGDQREINMELEPDLMALSEVVVVGYGEAEQEVGFERAEPVVGISEYKDYLKEELRYPQEARVNGIEGKVVLKLTISVEGEIVDAEVKRNLGFGADEEAIRLVKEGPEWHPAKRDGQPVESSVRVNVKFELD